MIGDPIDLADFVRIACALHGDRFDYALVVWAGPAEKVRIYCPTHGIFWQTPRQHLRSSGCCRCAKAAAGKACRVGFQEFVERARAVHGDRYTYERSGYSKVGDRIRIICPVHGPFLQLGMSHLKGRNCGKCGAVLRALGIRNTTEDWVKRATEVHGGKYDYSLVRYTKQEKKVTIICPIHGEFRQVAKDHLSGCACVDCTESKGEHLVSVELDKLKIPYEREKRFPGCRRRRALPFDFFLPSLSKLIEFDGRGHFDDIGCWRRLAVEAQANDAIKNAWAKENGYPLLRIKYTQMREISEIVRGFVCGDAAQSHPASRSLFSV